MKTLYITDLDGTLLNSGAELSSETEKLISQAIKQGADFTVATARTFATVMQMFKNIDLKLPLVLMNGVMLYEPSERRILSCRSISEESLKQVFDLYKKHKIYPLVYRSREKFLEIEYFSTDNPYQMKYVGNRVEADEKRFLYTEDFTYENKGEVIYIVTLNRYEAILPLYEELVNTEGISCVFYRDNYTDCYFLEIFSEGVSKASAMMQVKSLIGADKVIAFGDNLNDMDMFRAADEAYAVSNACNELKNIATAVISSNDENAVAEYIYKDYTEKSNE